MKSPINISDDDFLKLLHSVESDALVVNVIDIFDLMVQSLLGLA